MPHDTKQTSPRENEHPPMDDLAEPTEERAELEAERAELESDKEPEPSDSLTDRVDALTDPDGQRPREHELPVQREETELPREEAELSREDTELASEADTEVVSEPAADVDAAGQPDSDPVTDPEPWLPDGGSAVGSAEVESSSDLRHRWDAIQMRFVDDPASAAAEARTLVTEAIASLKATLEQREQELESWNADSSDTEELRQLFSNYRRLFETVIS
ncbi:hypothetical protein [Catelliglobosispora koreensis]|uniref:hypothetical protein n=1 Tax=Catelliglobosispora koreensis TaxID=129052 RepID=UPI0003718965|nr:hypothetical protein [Catelliglobosispora koreensis]